MQLRHRRWTTPRPRSHSLCFRFRPLAHAFAAPHGPTQITPSSSSLLYRPSSFLRPSRTQIHSQVAKVAVESTTKLIPFGEYNIFVKIFGTLSPDGPVPLIVLHGGPGATHDYLLSLAATAERNSAPVVFYDQIGNGQSTHLPDKGPDFWTVQLFCEQLDDLVRQLGIREYDVLGQSWGGMLAAEHALLHPKGLRRLVIANTPASMPLWSAASARYRKQLPKAVQADLDVHECDGTTNSEAYHKAVDVFYARHTCRVVPMPPDVINSFAAILKDDTVYQTMNGPSEFHVVGTLKDYTIIDRVHGVRVPTLVINGQYDAADDDAVAPFVQRIPGAKWVKFEESSHMPHVEETDKFLDVLSKFLRGEDVPETK